MSKSTSSNITVMDSKNALDRSITRHWCLQLLVVSWVLERSYFFRSVRFVAKDISITIIMTEYIDVLKIKAQTNPEAFKGRGVVKIFTDEGMNLYR